MRRSQRSKAAPKNGAVRDQPGEREPPDDRLSEAEQAELAAHVARAKMRLQQVLFPKTVDDFDAAFRAAGLSAESRKTLTKSVKEPKALEPLYRLLFHEGHIPVGNTMRKQQWFWQLYGGQRDARDRIPRKRGKLEITRLRIHTLIQAATVARDACKDLLKYAWSLSDVPEAIAAANLDEAIDRFGKLHAALEPPHWKTRVGRKSPLGKRERIFKAQLRLLLGDISPDLKKDNKFVNTLIAEVTALPPDWRAVFPERPTRSRRKRSS